MRKVSFALLLLTICISKPQYSFAWGHNGHKFVAEIAFTLLDSNTKQSVRKYLGGMTLEDAGNWMDDVRSDHKYDFMKSWHYVNIEKGIQYVETKEDNIINALTVSIEKLEHKDQLTDDDIKKNLLIVFHLVGDLHQPLHVGYGIDRGGNSIQVKYLNNSSNLHHVWDTEIIESEKISVNQCLLLYKTFDKDEIAQMKVINVEKWMHEPRGMLSNVYAFGDGNIIDQAYVDKNKKVIEMQLLIAGIRLSAILQDVFKNV